eukprot:TRINITY_DN1968_c0_g1_i1.p1 TRINITY_DN1968_c0_g1~~TRINITY_DN1968_c0_g1_i1.p1  ORF type:complete len:164 (-),score=36.31 TRINITY_DN1968_c0_g1_i1:335-826(-)
MSDFSNEILDNEIMKEGQMGSWTVLLGVIVTLMPKLIPRLIPSLIDNSEMRDGFARDKYLQETEHLFIEKFADNLKVLEKLVRAWKNDQLEPAQFGLEGLISREDFITGEPAGFQRDLLQGISFLKMRINKLEDKENGYGGDQITQIADVVWNLYTTIAKFVF